MSAAVGVSAGSPFFPSSPDSWFAMLNSDLDEATAAIGGAWEEIPPGEYSSRADRIVFYPEGLTLWAIGGKIIQLRIDSIWAGEIGGIRAGETEEVLRKVMGVPWIEETDSLYYNLPWNEGPVRLRFVFTGNGLHEVYLYKVR